MKDVIKYMAEPEVNMPHNDDFLTKHEESGHVHHSKHYSKHKADHKVHHDHVKAMCKGGVSKVVG